MRPVAPPRGLWVRHGSLSLLTILGAIAMLLYGAALFSRAMGQQVVSIALRVAMSDELNTATFLAKELSDNASNSGTLAEIQIPEALPSSASAYRETFDNFTIRHGVRAYVIDARSHLPVLEGATPLPLDATLRLPNAIRKVYGEPTMSQALAHRRKLQGAVMTAEGRQLVCMVPIAGTSHVLVLYRPEAPILQSALELTNRFTGYLLAAFSIVLVLFALFMRTLTSPLRALTQAVRDMGTGQLDQLAEPAIVEVRSGTEVGVLAEAFNQMRRELRVKYGELANTSRRLEESNARYREILSSYERQNSELSMLNTLVFETSRSEDEERNLEFLTSTIQRSYGLQLVALFEYSPRHGWELSDASDPLFETCDFHAGGLLNELRKLTVHRKLRLTRASIIGESRGSTYSDALRNAALCIAPVTVQGELEAAFVLISASARDFDAVGLQRFTRLTQQLGVVLHKNKLLLQTQRSREQLEKLNRLGAAMLADLEFDALMPRLLSELSHFLAADQSLFCLLERGSIRPMTAMEGSEGVPPHLHTLESDWTRQVVESGEALLVREYPRLSLWTPDEANFDPARAHRFQSYLGLPIMVSGNVIGALVFLSELPAAFDRDDIQFLTTVANQLAGAIQKSRLFQEISRRDKRRDMELASAIQLQTDRIPMTYSEEGLEATASFQPAGELAGDFYDIFRLSPNITGVVIGDVASKGVAASLLAFSMLSTFRHYATAMRPPAKVMELVNETMRTQLRSDATFVTAFYARLNHADLTMTYCKAGHVMPVLYRHKQRTCELLDGEGFPLGIIDGAEYEGAQVELQPGDRLVFYTDGVTELKNASGQLYGIDRLCEVIAAHGDESPAVIKAAIIAAIDAWAPGANRDDILLSVVGVQPPADIALTFTYDEMDVVVEKIMEEVRSFPVDATTLYAIRLALSETIANAWLHGHQGDRSAPIELTYCITESYFQLTVRDNGRGFDYENLPDPTVPENLIRTHGRGIFLMRQMMDDIEFNEAGNEIRVRKFFTFQTVQNAVESLKEANQQVREIAALPLVSQGDQLLA